MKNFSVEFTFEDAKRLADGLAGFDANSIGRTALEVVNETTASTHKTSVDRIVDRLNFDRRYVEQRLTMRPATNPVEPRAAIAAPIKGVNLADFLPPGPRAGQIIKPTNWTNEQLPKGWGKNPRAKEKWLRWKPRIGAHHLGIPVGQKQAGLSISVVRGQGATFAHSFLITASNGFTFVGSRRKEDHRGKGKVQAKFGPSVHQLFRASLDPKFLDAIAAQLQRGILDRSSAIFTKVIPL